MLSLEAQVTYSRAYFLAAKCQCDGRLVSNGSALTVDALYNPKVPQTKMQRIVQELSYQTDNDGAPWLVQLLDGTFDVPGWRTDQFNANVGALRQKRYRDRNALRHSDDPALRSEDEKSVTRYALDNIDIPPTVAKATSGGNGSTKKRNALRVTSDAPEWVPVLESAIKPLFKTELRSLTPDGLDTLGRYHCLVFANCTRDEGRNITNGQKVAAQLASLARTRDYGDITVAEYIAYGKKVHERRGGRQWFEPWLIKSEVEFDPA